MTSCWPASGLDWIIYWRTLFWACEQRWRDTRRWSGEANLSEAVAEEFADFTRVPSKLTLIFDAIETSVYGGDAGITRKRKHKGNGTTAELWRRSSRCIECRAPFLAGSLGRCPACARIKVKQRIAAQAISAAMFGSAEDTINALRSIANGQDDRI